MPEVPGVQVPSSASPNCSISARVKPSGLRGVTGKIGWSGTELGFAWPPSPKKSSPLPYSRNRLPVVALLEPAERPTDRFWRSGNSRVLRSTKPAAKSPGLSTV